MSAVVWIVSSEHWPRACLRAELLERGYDAVGFASVATARRALELGDAPAVAVIDLHGQTADLVNLTELAASAGNVIALAGTVEARSHELRRFPWDAFLVRPISLGAVADAVDGLLVDAGGSVHAP